MDAEEIARRIAAFREERSYGAAQLASEAVELLGAIAVDRDISDADFAELFPHAARQLGHARPSMAPLLNGAGTLLAAWNQAKRSSSTEQTRRSVAAAAAQWLAKQRAAADSIASNATEVIRGTVITLSYSSTVLRAIEACWMRDLLSGVLVAESRPLFEGRRTAADLASKGIPVALITDAQIGVFVSMANVAVVGADTLMAGGAVINKAGTLLLALAARRAHVPLYVLAGTQKIAPAPGRHHRMPFIIEEKDPEEVLPEPIEGVAVRNSYFDLTPGRYVTSYVTEDGLLTREEISARARHVPGAILLN